MDKSWLEDSHTFSGVFQGENVYLKLSLCCIYNFSSSQFRRVSCIKMFPMITMSWEWNITWKVQSCNYYRVYMEVHTDCLRWPLKELQVSDPWWLVKDSEQNKQYLC